MTSQEMSKAAQVLTRLRKLVAQPNLSLNFRDEVKAVRQAADVFESLLINLHRERLRHKSNVQVRLIRPELQSKVDQAGPGVELDRAHRLPPGGLPHAGC